MEASAATSRRMLQALKTPTSDAEESRAYLQTRLTVYSKLMFWSFITLLAFLSGMYFLYPEIKPANNNWIFGGATVGLVAMAFIWRVALVRRELSVVALYRIDLIYAISIGTAFGASAFFSPEFRPAGWTSLIFACFTVFTRALVVPSTGRRTTFVSAMAFVPVTASAIGLALTGGRVIDDMPPRAFVGGDLVISAVVVLLATTGSRVIYALNRKVSDAMQLGSYTLERMIGEGGMGVVYRAHHVLLRRPTAIKLMHPDKLGADNVDRFENEVRHMSQLTHPNTVAVYDYGRSPNGAFYYAMEYLGGGIDLSRLVKRQGLLPSGRVTNILIQVCGALQEAHDLGLIHRDIKPANIILCQRGGLPDVAKVVDFGLVKNLSADSNLSSVQIVLGTPDYIAPETLTDPANITASVDLYALGAVGYYLLTGRRVFEGKTAEHVVAQHVTKAPTPLSEVTKAPIPAALEALILQCLAKAPAARPASATALADALLALPPDPNWTTVEARAWWRAYRPIDEVAVSAMPTQTLPVALDHRV